MCVCDSEERMEGERDCITQYGSTVYIGIAMGCPAL